MEKTYLFSSSRLVFQRGAPKASPGPVEGNETEEKAEIKLANLVIQLYSDFSLYPKQRIAVSERNQRLLIQPFGKNKVRITWLSIKPGQKTYDKKEIYILNGLTGFLDKFRSNYSKVRPTAKDVIARLSYFNPKLKQKVTILSEKAEVKRTQNALKNAKRMSPVYIEYLKPAERKRYLILKRKKNLTGKEKTELLGLYYKIHEEQFFSEDMHEQDNSIANRIHTYWILGKPGRRWYTTMPKPRRSKPKPKKKNDKL